VACVIEKTGLNLTYVITECNDDNFDYLKRFPFVKPAGRLPHEEFLELLDSATLFIQNSSYEPFSLGVIEALCCGCSLLVSEQVGALGVIDSSGDDYIIHDTSDAAEIAEKIERILALPNQKKLRRGLNEGVVDERTVSRRLFERMVVCG
jgi:glycosyltransferase involved in cell wall biosynthesis